MKEHLSPRGEGEVSALSDKELVQRIEGALTISQGTLNWAFRQKSIRQRLEDQIQRLVEFALERKADQATGMAADVTFGSVESTPESRMAAERRNRIKSAGDDLHREWGVPPTLGEEYFRRRLARMEE